MQALKAKGQAPKMPPPPLCGYLVDYLFDAGPTQGGAPLNHSEIAAWMTNTGVDLTPWEASTLRHLSAVHLDQTARSSAPDCPAPWAPEMKPQDRASVSKKVQNAFDMLMRTRPQRGPKK